MWEAGATLRTSSLAADEVAGSARPPGQPELVSTPRRPRRNFHEGKILQHERKLLLFGGNFSFPTTSPLECGSEAPARRERTCKQAGPGLQAGLQQDDSRSAAIKARLPHLPLAGSTFSRLAVQEGWMPEACDGASASRQAHLKNTCGCTSAAPPVAPRALLPRSDASARLPGIEFGNVRTCEGFVRLAAMCEYTHRSLLQQRYTGSVATCSRKERTCC